MKRILVVSSDCRSLSLYFWSIRISNSPIDDSETEIFKPTLSSTQGWLVHSEIDCDLPKDKDGKHYGFFPKFSTIRLCLFEIVCSDLSVKRNHSFGWINPVRSEISWALSTIWFRETVSWRETTVWSRGKLWFSSFQLDGSNTINEHKPNFKIPSGREVTSPRRAR